MKFFTSEKFESIAEELLRRKWQQTVDDDSNDLLWVNLKSLKFESIGSDTIVNHMKGSQHLSNKALLAYHMHASGLGQNILPANWSSAFQDLSQLVILLLLNSAYCLVKRLGSAPICPSSDTATLTQLKEVLRLCASDKEVAKSDEFKNCSSLLSALTVNSIDRQKLVSEIEKVESCDRWRARWGGLSDVFIVKPVGLSCGEQIQVTSGLLQTLKCVEAFQYKCVVQKYIERPLLVRNNRKFDIRQWILVTSADPLVVFGYSECYLRLSSEEYSLDATKLGEAQVHLCNHAIQKFHNKGAKVDDSEVNISDSASADSSGCYDTMMTQSEFNEELVRRRIREWGDCLTPYHSFIQPKIQKACVSAVMSCRDRLQRVGRGFEWLGVDLMVCLHSDESKEESDEKTTESTVAAASDIVDVLILEVNVSPDISLSTPVTTRLVNLAIPDLFTLLLDEPTLETTSFSPDYHRLPGRTSSAGGEVVTSSQVEPKWELWYQASDEADSGKRPMTVLQFAHAKRSVEVLHTGDYRPRKLELFNSVMSLLKKGGDGTTTDEGQSGATDEDEDEI